jgi:hypothetical protein
MSPASPRRWAGGVVLVVAALVTLSVATVRAQDDATGSMCLLTLDEVRDATGLPFASTAEARGACTYAVDPSTDMLALDLRLGPEGDLDSVRFAYDREGQDTTVGDFPAWSSADGLFVDVGDRLLVVQPVFFLSDAAPDAVPLQMAVAELAAPRVGSAIEAAFGDEDRLTSLFPTEIAGLPVFVDVMNGRDFLSFVDLGTAAIEEVLASQGRTLDDLSIGTASTMDGDITALQVPGIDASLLLPAVTERLTAFGGTPTPTERAGKALVSFDEQGVWLYASGDVLWMITQPDDATLEAVLEVLP